MYRLNNVIVLYCMCQVSSHQLTITPVFSLLICQVSAENVVWYIIVQVQAELVVESKEEQQRVRTLNLNNYLH